MWVEDEDVDVIQAFEGFDRGGAGVARGRANDGDAFAFAAQCGLEHLADQLHGEVFERQCRAVEEFQ